MIFDGVLENHNQLSARKFLTVKVKVGIYDNRNQVIPSAPSTHIILPNIFAEL